MSGLVPAFLRRLMRPEIGAPIVFDDGGVIAKRVTAASVADAYYSPEIHLCSFLDAALPAGAPHAVYAYYARDFTVPRLRRWYQQLCREHAIDAVVIVDGGSDSLMRGDEEGLGDPIEDCVSVTTVVAPGEIFMWPLMAMVWGFDPVRVAERSLIAGWIRDCGTVDACYAALADGRAALGERLRQVENVPRHEELRGKPGRR